MSGRRWLWWLGALAAFGWFNAFASLPASAFRANASAPQVIECSLPLPPLAVIGAGEDQQPPLSEEAGKPALACPALHLALVPTRPRHVAAPTASAETEPPPVDVQLRRARAPPLDA